MTEPIAQNRSQVLAAKRWMDDEQGMERASLSPAEYLVYRMKVSPAEAAALVKAVYALDTAWATHVPENATRIRNLAQCCETLQSIPRWYYALFAIDPSARCVGEDRK